MRRLQLVTTENQETIKQLDFLMKISNGQMRPELIKPEIEKPELIKSDYFKTYKVDGEYYTPDAYQELTLQMSTGDWHTHAFKIIFLSEQDYIDNAINLDALLKTFAQEDGFIHQHYEYAQDFDVDFNENDSE